MTERKTMPLARLDQSFPAFDGPSQYLTDLTKRVANYLAQEPQVVFDHPYDRLAIVVWLQLVPGGYIAHMAVADHAHAKANCPADAVAFDLSELLDQKLVWIRDAHQFLNPERWYSLLHDNGNRRRLADNAKV
jgi:hypothetical protein